MIEVRFYRSGQSLQGFSAQGHAEFSDRGTDIVCSAFSALSQTAILALDQVAGVTPEWKRRDGFVQCRVPEGLVGDCSFATQVILKTFLTGLEHIACQYPGFFRVSYEEV